VKVKFSNKSISFLEELSFKENERIRLKIKELVLSLEKQGVIPFRVLDIKSLNGKWKGFMRLRTGKIRIIFKINREKEEILIYEIGFRGSVYK